LQESGVKKVLRVVVIVLVVALIAIQLVPVARSNPPVTEAIAAPDAVVAVLRESCFDCHSNETHWPWYAYVAPVSWLVAYDVEEGREHLNFSEWDRYAPDERAHMVEEVWEEIDHGAMPLPKYLRLHPGARLTDEDQRILREWTGAADTE
jgi:hypothetical protein